MVLNPKSIALKVYADLLSTNKERQINTIKEYYDYQSSFQDPLVCTKNAEETLAQFMMLSYINRVKGTPKSVLQTIENGRDVVVIDGIQEFGVTSWKFLSISLRVVTKFEFLDGKIIKHEDIWSFTDLLVGIPLLGTIYTWWRQVFAAASANLYNAVTGGPKLHIQKD